MQVAKDESSHTGQHGARKARSRSIFGWLALIGLLLLTSPGVRIARADDAPTCQGPGDSVAWQVQLQSLQNLIDAKALAAGRPTGVPTPDASGTIPLNNRGYRYTATREGESRARNGEANTR